MATFSLYVYMLQNNAWFLYPIAKECEATAVTEECQALYEFVRLHPPVSIVEILPVNDEIEVDAQVKQYMRRFGIDKVRGGSYSDVVLSDDTVRHLTKELSLHFNDYRERHAMLESIRHTYRAIDKVDLLDIIDEQAKYKESLDEYRTRKEARDYFMAAFVHSDNIPSLYTAYQKACEWICIEPKSTDEIEIDNDFINYMIIFISNRIDELDYELSLYPPSYELKTTTVLGFLEHHISTRSCADMYTVDGCKN